MRNAEWKSARRFRIPHSALRIVILVGACTRSPDAPRVPILIPPGASLETAVDSLSAHQVIRQPDLFSVYARVHGLRHSLKSGYYLLRPGAPWREIVATLERGHGAETRWTVPEGLMLFEIADLAREQLRVPRDSFLQAARDPGVRRELALPAEAPNLEGYLFPTTYVVPIHPGAHDLVRVMTREFVAQWQPEWAARLDSLHMTRHQLVTLASIIEAEVRVDADRPFVSAVYHNRLTRRMRLDADPTVIYAYGRRLKRVWEKNLAIASPYNTYLHTGLPPGPIGQPGRASLLAALYPAPVPFLYFVAQPDGQHVFSVTLADHEAAIRAVKRWRTESLGRRPRDR